MEPRASTEKISRGGGGQRKNTETSTIKVCLYRTRPRFGGVREEMVEIKQTKVVYTERESERGTQL